MVHVQLLESQNNLEKTSFKEEFPTYRSCQNKVDAEVFPIRVAKEPFMIEDWSVTNREDNDGLCASPSSPSTSISAVPDSFGNMSIGEQQPVVADFSNFKLEQNELANPTPIDSRPTDGMEPVQGRKAAHFRDANCRTDSTERLSKSSDVGVSKFQGWGGSPERNSPLFLSGLERPNGGPLSTSQVWICNRAKCSGGPGIRPELLKRIEDIQREVDSVNSPSLGPTQRKTDRGKGKRTKKS
ncbi:hypothetical protein Ancab_004735 [Ancistrocladus abbreviatus]